MAPHNSNRALAPRPLASDLFSDADSIAGAARTSGDSRDTEPPAKRRRVACQRCRQSKLRCDASSSGARPCQRCSALDLPCNIDTQYKRVSKRTTLNDLANHVELLKAATISVSASTSGATPSHTRSADHNIISIASPVSQTSSPCAPAAAVNHLVPPEAQQHQDDWTVPFPNSTIRVDTTTSGTSTSDGPRYGGRDDNIALQSRGTVLSRTIETITVEPSQIRHFFEIFFSFYHPSFPILSPTISPDTIYNTCPLLFWTIISTGARHDSYDFSLIPVLLPALNRLLWSTIPAAPHMLPALQAMALLCVWPFPVSSMPIDSTFIIAGILRSAAMHAGLHRPEVLAHYSRTRFKLGPAEMREAVRAWACIVVAIEGVAAGNGHQPYVTSDRTIEHASAVTNPHALPESLHQAMICQIFCSKVHSAMHDVDRLEGSTSQPTRGSLINVFEANLRELEEKLGSISHQARVFVLSASFQLRAYWLLSDEETSARREGVIKAFDTAIRFIEQLQLGEAEGNPVKYLTLIELRVCFTAATLISKVSHSSYGAYVDNERGKQAFNRCISIYKRCCVEDNDINGRVTKVLAQVHGIHARLFEKAPHQPPRLLVKSRFFFSIAHDSLWQWREEYAGTPSNGAPSLPPPLMSPASTNASEGPLTPSSKRHETESVPQMQSSETFGDNFTFEVSEPGPQQFLPPTSDFSNVDAGHDHTRQSLNSAAGDVLDNDHLAPGNDGDALLPFDMLFPDTVMGFTGGNWLQPMR